MRAVAEGCPACQKLRPPPAAPLHARYGNKEVADVNFYGKRRAWADIEHAHGRVWPLLSRLRKPSIGLTVCFDGDTLVQQLFLGMTPSEELSCREMTNSW